MHVKILQEIDDKYEVEFIEAHQKQMVLKSEFNESMESTCQPGIYKLNPQVLAKVEKISNIINRAVVATLSSRSPNAGLKLNSYATLADCSKEYCELLQCPPIDFIAHVKKAYDNFIDRMTSDVSSLPENEDEEEEENKNTAKLMVEDNDTKCSIGDMIKAKNKQRNL